MSGCPQWLAHSPSDRGHLDLLRDHLRDVGERAASYASAFGAAQEAKAAGLLHDIGKYGELFQKRLAGEARGIDHWTAAALIAGKRYSQQGLAIALVAHGHHVGLQSLSALGDEMKRFVRGPSSENEWHGPRPSERSPEVLLERFGCDGLELPEVHASIVESWQEDFVASMLDVRMLFSCVVDADYIETEAHREAVDTSTKRYRPQGPLLDSHRALASVLGYIEEVRARTHADPAILELRQDLLQACLQAAESPRGLFTLTAPTGAGKTLAMLAFALKHAATHGLRRIICVIPYLTIIEQTVEVYRKALGKACQHVQPMSYVLEDHSLAGIRSRARRTSTEATTADADQAEDASRLLAENWDAPVIVTTSVQFLESLFANRPGACRKLHRIAESVILFDEVQTLPTRLVEPTLAALSRLAHRYGCSVVLATATQPAFDHLHEHVRKYFRAGWQPTEIVPPSLRLFDRARRVEVKWPVDETKSLTWEALAERLLEHDQALCIVNLKRHAADLFDRLFSSQPDAQVFHLSTNMCPAHRQEVLEEVRGRLKAGEPCLLVSTQCVEAGVDVDFPVVFRAWGPLEAIAQAAGRCNREGKRQTGIVYVFKPPEDGPCAYPDGAYAQAAAVAESLLTELAEDLDIYAPEMFRRYYRLLYSIKGELTPPDLDDAIKRLDFPSVAHLYRLIREDAINVLVPYDSAAFEKLAQHAGDHGLTHEWISAARPYTVSIYRPQQGDPMWSLLEPVPVGRLKEPSDEWFIYRGDANDYDQHKGLMLKSVSCLIG